MLYGYVTMYFMGTTNQKTASQKRWAKTSKKKRKEITERARQAALLKRTPEQRKEHAKMMARALWDNMTPEQRAERLAKIHKGRDKYFKKKSILKK